MSPSWTGTPLHCLPKVLLFWQCIGGGGGGGAGGEGLIVKEKGGRN